MRQLQTEHAAALQRYQDAVVAEQASHQTTLNELETLKRDSDFAKHQHNDHTNGPKYEAELQAQVEELRRKERLDERALANRAAEYARHREQWKADREQDRRDHSQEVADLTKLYVSTVLPVKPLPSNACILCQAIQSNVLAQEALESRNAKLEADLMEVSCR